MGLGYVGLPLALSFCKKGYTVYGFDTNISRIDKLLKGESYITDVDTKESTIFIKSKKFLPIRDAKVLNEADIIIICVPTPLRKVKIPDISYVVKASQIIKNYLRPGQFIVLESTSYPTTTKEVVLPILTKTGLKSEEDFFLCFSPERVNPGDKQYPLMKIPKIVGGLTKQSTELGRLLYSTIVPKIFSASSPETAEMSKLLENTFRLVNIALINEFAIVANKLGINIWEVIEAAKTKPFGFMPFYPGPGVGGHCLPCDPIYLSWKARKLGFKTKIIDLAAQFNRFMPKYVVERVEELLKNKGLLLKDANICLLGVTYKKDVKDLRESPALDIINHLQDQGARVNYFDPFIPYLKIDDIDIRGEEITKKNIKEFDCIIIVTQHSKVDYKFIKDNAKLIFDTRNVYKDVNAKNIVGL